MYEGNEVSVLAEVSLGFLLFPPAEGWGFFSSSKHADQLVEASSVQMVKVKQSRNRPGGFQRVPGS